MIGCRQQGTVYRPWDGDRVVIATALMMYYRTTGEYPTKSQGLSALVSRPEDLSPETPWTQLANKVPNDPWGNKYQYFPPSGENPPTFEIRSFGRDGIPSDDDLVARFRADTENVEQTN
jgi:general secretion pathway protein G